MVAININRGTSGVSLPTSVSGQIWARTIQQSAVMQAATQVPLPGNGTTVPMITANATASWTAESEEKAISRPTIANKVLRGYTLSVIVPVSNQFRRDAGPLYDHLVERLPEALALKFDNTVFGVTAAPGSDFDTLATAPSVTVDATNTLADLGAAYNAVAANGGDLTAWLVSPALYGLLFTSTDAFGHQIFVPGGATDNQLGTVLGAPVYKSRAGFIVDAGDDAGDDTGVAGDFKGSALWGQVEGVDISIAEQATLNDGGTLIHLWQRNMFAVRAEIEVGFRVRSVNDFVRITDGTVDVG